MKAGKGPKRAEEKEAACAEPSLGHTHEQKTHTYIHTYIHTHIPAVAPESVRIPHYSKAATCMVSQPSRFKGRHP
jgi:hypothetical protein